MEDCGSSASTPVAGLSAFQVAQILVNGITNCDTGSSLLAADLGGGRAEIRFSNLRSQRATIRFNGGGEFGLRDRVVMSAPYAELDIEIPAVGRWGVGSLALALMLTGILLLRRGLRRRDHRPGGSLAL